MTTPELTSRRAAAAARQDNGTGLTFLRAVHAEWIKLTSLRSSYIILTIAFLAGMVGISLLSTLSVVEMATGYIGTDPGRARSPPAGHGGGVRRHGPRRGVQPALSSASS